MLHWVRSLVFIVMLPFIGWSVHSKDINIAILVAASYTAMAVFFESLEKTMKDFFKKKTPQKNPT